jgi:hypothetical protein
MAKKNLDYAALKRDVAAFGDEQVIDAAELAAFLSTTYNMIHRYNYIKPAALPPRLTGFGRKLCWRMGTCREWLRDMAATESSSAEETENKRTGRPRTTDQPKEPKEPKK